MAFDLAAGPMIKPINCSLMSRLGSNTARILEPGILFKSFGWPDSAQEFLHVLLTLVRYLNLYLQREPVWINSLKSHDLPTKPPFDWRKNEAVALILIERALGLLENWPTNMKTFVGSNRTRFKRLHTECGLHWPKRLDELVAEKIDHNLIKTEPVENSCNTKKRPVQDRVRQAVQYLLKTDVPVSSRSVCRIANVSFKRLKNEAKLNEVVLEGKSVYRLRQEAEVRNAVMVLQARGLNPSVRAIATYLGRSHRYLNAHEFRSMESM
jgi:hypothetical protein